MYSFSTLFGVGAREPLLQEKQWGCGGCGPQRGIDYALSDPGVDSGCSRNMLCLKKCSKCSPSLFYLGMWCCVCLLCACMALCVCVCVHSHFSSNPEGSALGLKSSFGKDSL